MSTSILLVLIIGGIGILLLTIATALCLLRRGPKRAGLLPSVMALALIAPICAIILGERPLRRGLTVLAEPGGVALAREALLQSNWSLFIGGIVSLATLMLFALFLVPSLFSRPTAEGGKPCASLRRSVFLLLLTLPPPLLALPLWHYSYRANALHRVVMFFDGGPAEKQIIEEEFEELKLRGSAGIAVVSRVLTRALMVKRFGGLFVATVLMAVVIIGALVAWPSWFSRWFTVAALLLTLLMGVMTAVGVVRTGLEMRAVQRVSVPL